MNNKPSFTIEEKVRLVLSTPEPSPAFVERLEAQLLTRPGTGSVKGGGRPVKSRSTPLLRRPAWLVAIILLALLAGALGLIGPQRVLAAFRQLLGYIPGVGIVDQSAPIRVLAEPVSVTRDGISVTVTSATLTANGANVSYRIFGVPGSAYPHQENVPGCMTQDYLRLPDGTQLNRLNDGSQNFQPVPAGVNQADLIIPCISGTLPGKAPENWDLALNFVPAPPDLTVMPVIELSPSPQASLTTENTAKAAGTDQTATPQADNAISVDQVIETSDGYILIGRFQPPDEPGVQFQQTGAEVIQDASGKKVTYTYPQDVNAAINQEPAMSGWAAQFQAAGLSYPLTISFSGFSIVPADPNATTQFSFDAGPDPQPGQVWTLNQDLSLAGHTLTLVSITAGSQSDYSFLFRSDPDVFGAAVQIEGYTPNGGGGGGGGGLTNGTFGRSLSYAQLPTGKLTVTVSGLTLVGNSRTYQVQWSPSAPRSDLPANPTALPGLCLAAGSSPDQLDPAPADLMQGKALLSVSSPDGSQSDIVLYNLTDGQSTVLVPNMSGGALSPDGS